MAAKALALMNSKKITSLSVYNKKNKNKTIIGDGAFIGSVTMLIAPIKIGNKSSTGAGSVVIDDVDDGSRVVGVTAKSIRK